MEIMQTRADLANSRPLGSLALQKRNGLLVCILRVWWTNGPLLYMHKNCLGRKLHLILYVNSNTSIYILLNLDLII